MKNSVDGIAEQILRDRRQRLRTGLIILFLACVVAGLVFWQLHHVGVAMTNEVQCGQEEHVHGEDCYELVLTCDLEETGPTAGHVHDEDCYETVTELVCALEESDGHIHDMTCYDDDGSLICGLPEGEGHTHSDACYAETQVLVCDMEESETAVGHVHDGSCYEEVLVCDIPEHTHTLACISDDTADVESAEDWELTIPGELPEDWAQAVAAVAESQLGYGESEKNFRPADDGGTRNGYTRYGEWYGLPYSDWDTMFASFCVYYGGVEDMPLASGAYAWTAALKELGLCVPAGETEPAVGDIVFFDEDGDGRADSSGIVTGILSDAEGNITTLQVIAGDVDGMVQKLEYDISDETILSYGLLPEQPADGAEDAGDDETAGDPGADTEDDAEPGTGAADADAASAEPAETSAAADPSGELAGEEAETATRIVGEKDFVYSDENLTMHVHAAGEMTVSASETDSAGSDPAASGEASLEMSLPAGAEFDDITMEIVFLEEDSRIYGQFEDFAEERSGELQALLAFELHFFYGDTELDLTGCEVTVEIIPGEAMLANAEPLSYTAEEGEDGTAELGMTIAALTMTDLGVELVDDADLSRNEEDLPTLSFSWDPGDEIALLAETEADPHFTVQFYAYLETIVTQQKDNDTDLTVIETHTENGAVLPTNNGTTASSAYNTSVVELVGDGNGGFVLDTEMVLTEMYSAEAYEYIEEPDLEHMNKLEKNGDYALYQIWVLNEGKNQNSTDSSDWQVYTYTEGMDFTNNPDAADDSTILIEEGSVFRFVYNTTENDETITANFYDYNIADGNVYAAGSTSGNLWSSGSKYLYTAEQGINSSSNYSGSGTKLGFGNNNTGSGLGELTWSNNGYSNELNKYNNNGLLGCTFSLVSSLDDSGHIVYSSGVNAPSLFDDGDADGKETFSNAQLTFTREGDTYTLTAATGSTDSGNISASSLDTFSNPGSYTYIFTNNFWPLDNVSYTGMDPLFGGSSSVYYFGNSSTTMPASDDGEDHNSYFGMNFAIEFSYTNDYVGPLEYFFFGDDDMWVFLDDQLVLDIGGVHSSVGEHVDLWDYLAEERDSLGDDQIATHTLSVYYTERGASGSTCYIRYTLPSVSSVTPVDNTGTLKVQKLVKGAAADTEKEFTFTLSLQDASGKDLDNLYSYTVYKDESTVDHTGSITSGDSFTLRDGWWIEIHNLPAGTVAAVTETEEGGYSASWTIDGGETNAGTNAAGVEIEENKTTTVVFVNEMGAELPSTGGTGVSVFAASGLALICGSGVLLLARKRRKERT